MKPAPFEYEQAHDLRDALAILDERGSDVQILAGGQSLVPLLNFRLARPVCVVDINRVGELSYVRRKEGILRIGTLTRQAAVERSDLIATNWPLLTEATAHIAHFQIRNRGTVGGSVAHADPAGELPTVFTALDARFHIMAKDRTRSTTCDEFYVSHLTTSLAPDELLTEIEVPPLPKNSGTAFMEFALRHGDFALAGVATSVTPAADGGCADARIGLLGAAPTPIRARAAEQELQSSGISDESLDSAAATAVKEASPSGDIHGDAEYRKHLLEVLTRRALHTAAARAGK